MTAEIKLNSVLISKKYSMLGKVTPKCKENKMPCVFYSQMNKAISELGIIELFNLCPNNDKVTDNIIKKVFADNPNGVDKEQLISYQEAIYSTLSMVEEEILLSIGNGRFQCSEIQEYIENILNLFVEERKGDA